jgi:hypothetical protein
MDTESLFRWPTVAIRSIQSPRRSIQLKMADDPQWPFLSIEEGYSTERGRIAILDAEWRISTTVYFPARQSPPFSLFAEMETLRGSSQSMKVSVPRLCQDVPLLTVSTPHFPGGFTHRL